MAELLTSQNLLALLTLTALEIVLGIDNIVFIAIISAKLPPEKQAAIRRLGLGLAMAGRILLLLGLSWVIQLKEPLFEILGKGFSGRDLILLGGGLFLMAKATYEIHGTVEGGHGDGGEGGKKAYASVASVVAQILVLDLVFSLDSVITAVGMADSVAVMITAVVIAVTVMLIFATPVSEFIMRHPTVKMLALSFLMLIGVVLVADGWGQHIQKGYVYFAMGFSIFVELLNFRMRRKRLPAAVA